MFYQLLVQEDKCQTDGRRIDIIGRLSAVGMVVGRTVLELAFLVSHDFAGTVGNHFIGIHVDGCAGTALHHVSHKVLVHLAGDDFPACLCHGISHLIADFTQLPVGLHGSQLDIGNGDNVVGIVAHTLARDVIVVDGTLCLHAVISLLRYLKFAQEVAFYTKFLFFHDFN